MATTQEWKDWFGAQGLTISQWAADHGFKSEEVYAVLSGRTVGRRGRAHEVAVALGIKLPPRGPAPNGKDPHMANTDAGVSDPVFCIQPTIEEKR